MIKKKRSNSALLKTLFMEGAPVTSATSEASEEDHGAIRVYVADMASQLALIALDGGDRTLAKALEVAAELAARPVPEAN